MAYEGNLRDYVEYKDKKGNSHIMLVQSIMYDPKTKSTKVGTIGAKQVWVDVKDCKKVDKPKRGTNIEKG